MDYPSGGQAIGQIVEIQVERTPGTTLASFSDGTASLVELEDSLDLLITVKGRGLSDGRSWSVNRVYDLGVNSSRNYMTKQAQFTGTVADIW